MEQIELRPSEMLVEYYKRQSHKLTFGSVPVPPSFLYEGLMELTEGFKGPRKFTHLQFDMWNKYAEILKKHGYGSLVAEEQALVRSMADKDEGVQEIESTISHEVDEAFPGETKEKRQMLAAWVAKGKVGDEDDPVYKQFGFRIKAPVLFTESDKTMQNRWREVSDKFRWLKNEKNERGFPLAMLRAVIKTYVERGQVEIITLDQKSPVNPKLKKPLTPLYTTYARAILQTVDVSPTPPRSLADLARRIDSARSQSDDSDGSPFVVNGQSIVDALTKRYVVYEKGSVSDFLKILRELSDLSLGHV